MQSSVQLPLRHSHIKPVSCHKYAIFFKVEFLLISILLEHRFLFYMLTTLLIIDTTVCASMTPTMDIKNVSRNIENMIHL